MAQTIKYITHQIVLTLIILAIFSCSSKASDYRQLNETNLTVLYIHDFPRSGSNATVTITGIPGKMRSYPSFGSVFVTLEEDDLLEEDDDFEEDPMTADRDKNLPKIYWSQDVNITSSLKEVRLPKMRNKSKKKKHILMGFL